MTERQAKASTVAMFSVAVSVAGLAITIAYGIAKAGFYAGNLHNEHQQIFAQQVQAVTQQQQTLKEIRELAEKKCQ